MELASDNKHSLRRIDEQYMHSIFTKHYKGLCLFARQFVHDNEKVEDLVQDIFLKIWEKGELYEDESLVKNYLYTSVRNRCLNFIRDNKKFNDNLDVGIVEGTHEHNRTEYRELEKMLHNAIQSLPEKCREVFELSRFQNMKYQEIADTLGISIKTVEAQMSKALRVLREKLSAHTNGLLLFFRIFFLSGIRVNQLLGVNKS